MSVNDDKSTNHGGRCSGDLASRGPNAAGASGDVPRGSRMANLASQLTPALAGLVGRGLAAVLVAELVAVDLDPVGGLRLEAARLRPVGEDLDPLRELGVAHEVVLLLLVLGGIRILALFEPHDEVAPRDLERSRERRRRREREGGLRELVRDADALDHRALARALGREQAGLLGARRRVGLLGALVFVVGRRGEELLERLRGVAPRERERRVGARLGLRARLLVAHL